MKTDFLIIGSGIAGLSLALRVAEYSNVILVTKKDQVDSATNLAQGGIAAVLGEDDDVAYHIKDTLVSGADLCDKNIVEMVVKNGPARVRDLIEIGVNFVKDKQENHLDLGREGGHSRRRVAHAYDLTGREIERSLLDCVKKTQAITVLENYTAVDLILDDDGNRCIGCYVLQKNGIIEPFLAKVTTLCTGGCGKVYLYTSNPDISTGDGVAMAFRAGAKISNMEFIQFHPTCLFHSQAKNFLISEAVRGEGGVLVDANGVPFMSKYDKRGDLATRDAVARAIDSEMKERGFDCVFLDITHKSDEFLHKRFPTIYERCWELGIKISRDPIPVVPAAHYMCGGVMVDCWGKSSIENLFVLGETSNTGLHGGNRLASNSLLEAVVYAERAASYCKDHWHLLDNIKISDPLPCWSDKDTRVLNEEILINHNWDIIRRIMWNYVGIVRNTKRLQLAKERLIDIIQEIEQHYKEFAITSNMIELRNISHVAMLIVEAALQRKMSRGLHCIIGEGVENEKELFWNVFEKSGVDKGWSVQFSSRKMLD